jgi:RNA polymerase sigma factor (sigma-70 family)
MTVIDAITQNATREDHRAQLRRSCESVFREHNDALVRFAYGRVRSWDAARDLVQSAYAKIFAQESPPAFRFLHSYIYKAVGTLCLDALKKRRNHSDDFRQTRIYDALYAPRAEASPENEALVLQARELLDAALLNLPPRARMAFTLVEMQGYTVGEAAEAMQTKEAEIYVLIARGYATLARAVAKLTPTGS